MTSAAGTHIVQLLAKQEEAMASLYAVFSSQIKSMASFWQHLVVQERAHRDVLLHLAKMVASGQVRIDTTRFNGVAVQTSITNLEKQRDRAIAQGIQEIKALAIASDIEHSLIEAGYFQVILTENPSVASEIEELETHTKQHIAIVDSRLAAARNIRAGEEK